MLAVRGNIHHVGDNVSTIRRPVVASKTSEITAVLSLQRHSQSDGV